jgi:hypothetical protein
MGSDIKVNILDLLEKKELKQLNYFDKRSIRSYEAKGQFEKALERAEAALGKFPNVPLRDRLIERRGMKPVSAEEQQSTSQQPPECGSLVVNENNMPGVYSLDRDRVLRPVVGATVDNPPNLPPGKYTMGEDGLYSENLRFPSDGGNFLPSGRYTLKSDGHLYIKDPKDGYPPGEYQLCQRGNVFYLKSTELKRSPSNVSNTNTTSAISSQNPATKTNSTPTLFEINYQSSPEDVIINFGKRRRSS